MSIQWWRDELKTTFDLFAKLKADDRTLDVEYGIVGGAILWPIRDIDAHSDDLAQVCGDTDSEPIRERLRTWQSLEFTPKQAAKHLSREAKDDGDLQAALDALLLFFREDILDYGMLQPAKVDIRTGNIRGGNIVIGGSQYVAGDLIIRYLVKENVRACPTAPNPPKHFTGRDDQLTVLREQLTGEDIVAITAVHAMGGMGKTTLAQALCHQADNLFPTVLWAEITQNPDARSHLTTWGSYARDDYQMPPDTPLEQIADYVRAQLTKLINEECGRPVLVVFDDVWENGYETVELLRRAAPDGAQILITTRHDNVVQRFQAKSLTLYELSDEEAIALLNKLRDSRFITDAHIERAVSLIKGHPLALELAAASLNQAEDADDIEYILDEYERGIQDGSPFDAMDIGAERPRSLNVVFERSYEQLSDENQRCFRALGVLAPDASWERPLARAIWNIKDEREQVDVHKALRTAALIQRDDEITERSTGTWYSQHLLLRAYARALLDEADETDDAFRHYAEYMTEVAEQFDELSPEEWSLLDGYLPHLHSVGDTLAAYDQHYHNEEPGLARLFSMRTKDYVLKRPESHRLNWLEMGLAVSRIDDEPLFVQFFLNPLGLYHKSQGQTQPALEYFVESVQMAEAWEHHVGKAAALNNIAEIYRLRSELDEALNYYHQALIHTRLADSPAGEASILNNIGLVYQAQGRWQEALKYQKQALASKRAYGGVDSASTLNNLGQIYHALGDIPEALNYYEQALSLLRAAGDLSGEAVVLDNTGKVYSEMGEAQKALPYFQQALSLIRQVNNPARETRILNSMSEAHRLLDNLPEALRYQQQSIQLSRQISDQQGEATSIHNLALIYLQNGKIEEAVNFFQQALEICIAIKAVHDEIAIRMNLALAQEKLERKTAAIDNLQRAIDLLESNNLSRDASGLTIAHYRYALASLQGDTTVMEKQVGSILNAVNELISSKSMKAARQVYKTHRTLLELPETELAFRALVQREANPYRRRMIKAYYKRIQRAKTEGVDIAFAD